MRTMLKSVLVTLAAVLALSTAIAATASASQPQWEVKEGETWKVLGEGESRDITLKSQGTQVFSFPSEDYSEITCEKLEGKAGIYPGGTSEFTELKYTGCGAVSSKMKIKCGWVSSPEQPNGTIRLLPGDEGILVAKEGAIYYEVKENSVVKEFVHIIINRQAREEGGGLCGLIPGGERTLKGSFLGKINNATSELEFAGEGTLKLGTYPLEYSGRDLLELEGGGAIRAS